MKPDYKSMWDIQTDDWVIITGGENKGITGRIGGISYKKCNARVIPDKINKYIREFKKNIRRITKESDPEFFI